MFSAKRNLVSPSSALDMDTQNNQPSLSPLTVYGTLAISLDRYSRDNLNLQVRR